jgi:uncharacterized SAM-binding protein YcdF (DUF218 family)
MFFLLSKSVVFLLLPSNILIVLAVVGAVLLAIDKKRAGTGLLLASIILLAIAGWWPTGHALIHALESRFPPWNSNRGAPDGIVVLGGALESRLSREFGEPVIGGDGNRVVALGKLARTYPDARIIYSGGDSSLLGNQPPEAEFVYQMLDSLGLPRGRILLEPRSRNTAENAVFTKALANPRADERWLLVTSAQHMPRAVGAFRRVGFPVEAYPVGWRTGPHAELGAPRAFGDALGRFDSAAREWIGLLVYWATGKTGALLPSP